MREFPRPVVVVSACLEFENVRYDGKVIPCKIVRDLEPFVEYIKVCPEVAIGLGVPRDPIRIVKIEGKKRLIQPKTNADITDKMNAFTTNFINTLPDVDGFIFKSKSPTIGLRGIKVYSGIEKSPVIEKSSGFFADQILERFPDYPMEEDDRLRNETIRHHFLVMLFTFADFRQTKNEQSLEALVAFHEKNHFLFLAYSTEYLNELEKIIRNGKKAVAPILEDYFTILKKMFARHPRFTSNIYAVQQLYRHFSGNFSEKENALFEAVLEEYERNKIGFRSLIVLLKSYVARFEDTYLEKQTFLEPYPPELRVDVDPNRDKDYWKTEN